ncbi:MAG TPA: hypothetical protein VF731_03560 [Solirubrobacterales bacterium]
MALLATKILLAPLCVVAVSLAGRRWGVATAGVLGGLPVVAGPILLVLTLQHGRSFGADAATGTLLGLAALTTFVVVYGWVANHVAPAGSVLAGWAAFLLGVALLDLVTPGPAPALVFVGCCFAIGLVLLSPPEWPRGEPAAPPWWDLPARALAALALVVAVTAASGALGPGLSGLLAPFPIITSVFVFFTHSHRGLHELRVLSRNFLVGFYGFATFCFVLAIALPGVGTAAAFGLALVAALAVQITVHLARRRLGSADLDREGGDEALAGLDQRQVGAAGD